MKVKGYNTPHRKLMRLSKSDIVSRYLDLENDCEQMREKIQAFADECHDLRVTTKELCDLIANKSKCFIVHVCTSEEIGDALYVDGVLQATDDNIWPCDITQVVGPKPCFINHLHISNYEGRVSEYPHRFGELLTAIGMETGNVGT